jgi:hypothetical protein
MPCGCVSGAITNREAVVVERGILAAASNFDGSRYAFRASTAAVSTAPTVAKYFKISMGRPFPSPRSPMFKRLLRIRTTNKAQSRAEFGVETGPPGTRHPSATRRRPAPGRLHRYPVAGHCNDPVGGHGADQLDTKRPADPTALP